VLGPLEKIRIRVNGKNSWAMWHGAGDGSDSAETTMTSGVFADGGEDVFLGEVRP
jgi:hypothetical protein